MRNMSTALGHGSIAFGRTISSVLQGFFGIFNPILLNRNSNGKLWQLHSGMDRFWKKKIFLIPGYSGIFNPNTLTPFSWIILLIPARHGSLSEDEQFLHSWVFWNLQPKSVRPKFYEKYVNCTRAWIAVNNFVTLGGFWNLQPNYVEPKILMRSTSIAPRGLVMVSKKNILHTCWVFSNLQTQFLT